jgi:tRNA(Ile)-lysidine synthase
VSARRPVRPDAANESPASPDRFGPLWLRSQLRSLITTLRNRSLCVAYSGGLDSTALLCALVALRGREGLRLRALHVNHQLQPLAGHWARQARRNARRLRVPCEVLTVTVRCARGESLEAAARAARYRALVSELDPGEVLLTAHHQEDQLETVLLALMRGSGLRGLSAMTPVSSVGGFCLLRPLLPVPHAQLEHFLKARKISWSEDPSNTDERFDRNYLRRTVVPLLRARWPAVAATAGRSAALLSQARVILERLADKQLQQARDGRALRVSVLRRLPAPERVNALRTWLSEQALPMPDQRRMREISGPMLMARSDAMPCVQWQGAQLRRHGDRLLAFAGEEDAAREPALEVAHWNWRAQPWLSLGAGGLLGLMHDPHGDVRLSALPPTLRVRYRRAGERLTGTQGSIALKDLLQQRGLAPWERDCVPLVMHHRTVVAVADLWLSPKYVAQRGEPSARARFRWRHHFSD